MKRVVVTGMGVISPLGCNVEQFWNQLAAGVSGIAEIEHFDSSQLATRIGGTARDFRPESYMSAKEVRQYDRYLQFAIAAAQQAIDQAGLDIADQPERVGVYVGTGIGGLHTLLENHRTFLERGPKRVSPFMIPMMIGNMAAGLISIRMGAKGPNMATVSACATSNHAIGEAFHLIRSGRADAMIAGGTEAPMHELAFAGFSNMQAMSVRNEEPARASRPFDLHRDGFVMGEGAGVLVLEERDHALARGAAVLAEIIGYGTAADAYHMTAPDPEGKGACQAMKEALEDARLSPQSVDYINAHATGTPLGDAAESKAIESLFGAGGKMPLVSSTKSMTGHLFGAAGAIEAVAVIQALRCGIVPPTINYETPDPACRLDYVPNIARAVPIRTAMSNGFGFGGHNASLVFRT
ncbi:beta-ketoacyl-[acyl-carrier-protein] synthase II [Xylanibacillus composti]|uniref:3-oxoacyl-[acyl-carrier-protein] synthase 2 n=1 Tax=Xylanibacillus composti TaxID=1572762 RepID=A0A8J4M1C5_9BACL|nr:beta-ketoacyl-ACP synthase II [Xylanibacillus composti]MDT9726122.1 beta-ketoacyl-[acyl-carrier-protein] synthase II [Xylanibacillus composti]GIQ68730.1 3-oxoacyl-[acyl-carrier-protein] synthase 2 [Xylanibacillus composti]